MVRPKTLFDSHLSHASTHSSVRDLPPPVPAKPATTFLGHFPILPFLQSVPLQGHWAPHLPQCLWFHACLCCWTIHMIPITHTENAYACITAFCSPLLFPTVRWATMHLTYHRLIPRSATYHTIFIMPAVVSAFTCLAATYSSATATALPCGSCGFCCVRCAILPVLIARLLPAVWAL